MFKEGEVFLGERRTHVYIGKLQMGQIFKVFKSAVRKTKHVEGVLQN